MHDNCAALYLFTFVSSTSQKAYIAETRFMDRDMESNAPSSRWNLGHTKYDFVTRMFLFMGLILRRTTIL